jgi:Zn-dependent M28 family amino/carboxypeptidase
MKITAVLFVFCVTIVGIFSFYLSSPLTGTDRNKSFIVAVDKQSLYKHVQSLTNLVAPRTYENTVSLDSAAEYIQKELEQSGYRPAAQTFNVNGAQYKNIIAFYGDPKLPRVIIGAHYDVCDTQPGADDNASGVAALLEVARLLKLAQLKLPYAIELVAYTLEEPPFFRSTSMGSYVHAKSLYDSKVQVVAMISLEMLGYYSDQPNSQSFPLPGLGLLYPDKGNFIAVVGKMGQGKVVREIKRSMKKVSDLGVESITAPGFVTGIDFSDHLNYWQFGFNAVMITDTSFFRNRNYHQTTDTIDTLNFDKMAEVVKGIYWAVISLTV